MWIDTHCHLDAAEFAGQTGAVRSAAAAAGVGHVVIPAVEVGNFEAVRNLAHAHGDSYCLGIHPLYVARAQDSDLAALEAALARWHDDPHLVAVGEIGLDFFVPELQTPELRARQEFFYRAQLKLARRFALPVVLHVRRSADRLLKHLREVGQGGPPWLGIAHAFNGSLVQAQAFVQIGLRLGFGGALTFERALQLRRLAHRLPLAALVLETDAPDIAPQWLYTPAALRAQGQNPIANTPAQLPRIGAVLAALRGMAPQALETATQYNACQALPRLGGLLGAVRDSAD